MRAARQIRDRSDAETKSAPLELLDTRPAPIELRLLPAWSNPIAEFSGNLFDVLRGQLPLFGRQVPMPDLSWYGADFESYLPWPRVRDSLLVHAGIIVLLYAASIGPELGVHLVRLKPQTVSLYLPELHGARVVRKRGGKADPVLARQEIRSVSDKADNRRQTIAMLSRRQLRQTIELPNFIAFQQPPPAPPLDTSAPHALLKLPAMLPELAQRVADIVQLKPQRATPSKQHEAQPAPEIGTLGRAAKVSQLLPSTQDPALPLQAVRRAPEIVQQRPQRAPSLRERMPQSPPNMGPVGREKGAELARLIAPANPSDPELQKQRRAAEIVQQRPQRSPKSTPASAAAQPEPQPESFGSKVVRTLSDLLPQRAEPALPAPGMPKALALNAHPAEIPVPAEIPEGNRRGAFAASPTGRENATGEPGAGTSSDIGAHDTGAKVNAPPGISVGVPPSPAVSGAASGARPPNSATADPELKAKLLASARTPAIGSIPRQATPSPAPVERAPASALSELENRVFAGRRSYKLVINMPNLNAAIGSWIIRYAERGDQVAESEPIIAPEVVLKSDPAVRGELIDGGLHGTVVMTAIILADGSVDQIKVVQGVFPELDQKASEALSRWLFRPALKNGQPIEVEALVAVPIRKR